MKMEKEDRYYELENIVSTINVLITEILDKDYIEQLEFIKFQAENEMEEIETELIEEQEKEAREMNYLYERSAI